MNDYESSKATIKRAALTKNPGKPRVLIVDDDPTCRKILSRVVHKASMQPVAFGNPHDALEIAESIDPAFIILDIYLPYMDGLSVLKKLREIPSVENTPIIFITAGADEKLINEAFKLGAIDFIEKPINYADLMNTVNRYSKITTLFEQQEQTLVLIDRAIKLINSKKLSTNVQPI